MKNYILFDDDRRLQLLPFTHTRSVADIRCGILTLREKWELVLGSKTSTLTESYLQQVFPVHFGNDNVLINGGVFATKELVDAIELLQPNEVLLQNHLIIAARLLQSETTRHDFIERVNSLIQKNYEPEVTQITHPWDIFSLNGKALRSDFELLTKGRTSQAVPEGVLVSGSENLFIEEGARINLGCIINAAKGPVYISKNSEILEGVMIHGPFALGEHAVIKMGAKIYGDTTIGPGCKVGGEVNNVVFFANSNKGHDGYLGNSVIGEWCNLGADTNCSNLKNNYDEVKVHSEFAGHLVRTGLTFCGLLMADHSKSGINTMFNTGTVVGVSANIFGSGFPDKFIPSFAWGGGSDVATYDFDKAMETASRVMARRGRKLQETEKELYRQVFENTRLQRG